MSEDLRRSSTASTTFALPGVEPFSPCAELPIDASLGSQSMVAPSPSWEAVKLGSQREHSSLALAAAGNELETADAVVGIAGGVHLTSEEEELRARILAMSDSPLMQP